MPAHDDCKNWEYDTHPNRASLTAKCARLDRAIGRRPFKWASLGYDTRRSHAYMFAGLVPPTCKCLAGHYRGSTACKALTKYSVVVLLDHYVGVEPGKVAWHIKQFEAQCKLLQSRFSEWKVATDPKPPEAIALLRFVKLLAEILERFFTIHPYANGNGHAGRLLLLVLMARAGYPPANWSIDGKKDYGNAIFAYRRGNKGPLEDFILDSITGP